MSNHVVIVGAGAVGCLSALELAERGWKVTLLDRGPIGGEASWAGGGIMFPLLPWNYTEPVNRLAMAGIARYPALCASLLDTTGIAPEYLVCGMQVLPDYGGEAAIQWCRSHGMAADVREDGLWLPQVSQVRNPRLLQALHARLLALGVSVTEHIQLAPLQDQEGKVTAWHSLDGQVFEADAFVLTAGAWSRNLLGTHALGLQHKPMRGQMLLYKLHRQELAHIIFHEDFYLIPRRDGHVLAGSTVEDVGFDKSTTAEAAARLAAKAAARLPQLADVPLLRHWAGLRPGSPDNIPVIDRHPQFDNLYLNTGHFRYGVTMAPASAEILARLVCGEAPDNAMGEYPFP